jgi:hypothetical protein
MITEPHKRRPRPDRAVAPRKKKKKKKKKLCIALILTAILRTHAETTFKGLR